MRGELSDARRRVDIANHARKQALIVTALFRAQCEEAAREKRDLLVRRDDARDERATFAPPSTKRPLVVRSRDMRALSRSPAAFTAQARLRASSEEITKLKIQLDAQAGQYEVTMDEAMNAAQSERKVLTENARAERA